VNDPFDYNAAKRKLCEFLERHSFPSKVAWVFAEDMAWVDGAPKVRSPLPKENEVAVRAAVESETAQKLGVELRAVAKTAEATLCGVIVPVDKREAEELMISGLKLSVPERALEASEVTGWVKWRLARMRQRKPSLFADLPKRKNLGKVEKPS
jgi:hypothetical protein